MKSTTTITTGSAQRFVDSVAEVASNVIIRCCDKYSAKETPLLADGINLKTGEPITWEGHVLSNLACQQNFLRALDGLALLTGEAVYRDQADQWIRYALNALHDSPSGMLYWGGHTCYDLLEDRPLIGNHELKCGYPYYRFLYQVAPETTRLFIEGFWNKHIQDWSTLLFNRHGEYTDWARTAPWEHGYEGGPLPIVENTRLSFINTGSDLIYAGALLCKLSGNRNPLLWAKRLAQRYDEVRNETTGLAGYQFNHREPCRVRISFKEPLGSREDVNETTVITSSVIQTRYGRAAITWLNLFEELGIDDGQEFLDLASKDLTAICEHSYDFNDHSFSPVLLDGTKLSPADSMEGVGYCPPEKLASVPANGLMFFAYAKAYRLTRKKRFAQTVSSLAEGMGWGGVFDGLESQASGVQPDFSKLSRISPPPRDGRANPNQNDVCALFGLLELYQATHQRAYLESAVNLGNRLVQAYFIDGFFTTAAEATDGFTNIDNALPLALLHLAAAIEEKPIDLPTFYPNFTDFGPKVIIARRSTEKSAR